MARANLANLNDMLFGLLEEVLDDTDKDGVEKTDEQKKRDLEKTESAVKLSKSILDVSRLQLDAYKYENEIAGPQSNVPALPSGFVESK